MMSDVSKPVAKNMTSQSSRMLEALRSRGEWMTRAELAKAMGKDKKAWNKWDTALLDLLISQALVETKQEDFHGPIGYKWMYRATDKEGSA